MSVPESERNIRVRQTEEELSQALRTLKEAQDSVVREALRQEALDKLYRAADAKDAQEMKNSLKLHPEKN